ncbi:hypothetical protein WN51_05228 [Melipona quadrifasciata]|uniref:Uncharacterized protein n=1 Tax=Melipona quadrifasciata TaxID=166423 RepID=A0A0N0U3T7_9HYME|nr:hypothetical protein WN51_05228 [Melipona quadrifasciata]
MDGRRGLARPVDDGSKRARIVDGGAKENPKAKVRTSDGVDQAAGSRFSEQGLSRGVVETERVAPVPLRAD